MLLLAGDAARRLGRGQQTRVGDSLAAVDAFTVAPFLNASQGCVDVIELDGLAVVQEQFQLALAQGLRVRVLGLTQVRCGGSHPAVAAALLVKLTQQGLSLQQQQLFEGTGR
jgi:hypothetical protein